MALYEYLCPACRRGFELIRPMSDAHKGALCPECGSDALKIISGSPGAERPAQAPDQPSRKESEILDSSSEARAANQRIGMIPAFDIERITGSQGGPPGESRGQETDVRRSTGSTTVSAPTAVREGAAAHSEVDLWEDTARLEMPWLAESQPGGGNLWYIRDWGIASMFGYLRERRATEAVGESPLTAAETDANPVDSGPYGQVSGQQDAAVVEPDLAAGSEDGAGGHLTFSEWRTAISIMPWLQETNIEPPEAHQENPDIVSADPDMPGLRPRRNKGTVQLASAGWLHGQPAAERPADPSGRRLRPLREAKARTAPDFPDQVVEAAWRRQGGRCAGCGRWLIRLHRNRDSGTGAWESHHRIPVDHGGSSLLANCVLLCSGAADCHFNRGHGGIGWTHYAPLDESALLFLFAGSTKPTSFSAQARPRRNLLREVLGIPQRGSGSGKRPDGSSGPDSTG